MAVELKQIEEVAQELGTRFTEFKAANDARFEAESAERLKLVGTVEKLNGQLSELETLKADLEKELKSAKRPGGGQGGKAAAEHKSAFMNFVRKGNEDGLRELEQKALQTGVAEDGGYAVPEDLDRSLLPLLCAR